ncbi:MAG TPA: hypothetical protein VGQ62_03120 [Chloroflexota bacterium]|jgi:hypothetical protein|nr:hypothetical protein [Chloroflexota bacterium]
MTMLSPAATYHAELREQLGTVGRALSVQRALLWLARGVAAGALIVLGLVIWAWARDGSLANVPLALLVSVPIVLGLTVAFGSLFIRHKTPELARRIDRAARLQERSTTALELGARGEEFPLAVAQMRDAVEHLKRVDLLDAFPLRVPRNELMTAFFLLAIATIVAVSPNPWLLRARASNPAITIAREQAQRVQRLADSIQPANSPELEALRQLVSKGARTVDARSNEPDAALNSLQDLEEQIRQMSAGDDQLAAALSAIAGALAADQATQQLSSAINTGDMRQIAQAAKDLAQAAAGMSGQDQQRVAKVLRDAAGKAGRVSQSVSGQLSDAADAMQGATSGDSASQMAGQQGQTGQGTPGQQGSQTSNGRSAQDALNQLSDSAGAAGERQRAASQLESSRNALERALGRTQSRSGSSGRSSSSSSQRSQASSQQAGDQAQGGQGQGGDQAGDGTDGNAGGQPGGDQGNGADTGQGGGYSNGGQNQNRTGPASNLDTISSPQQVPSNGAATPDQSSSNPYLADAGTGNAETTSENVQPSFSRKPTTGNDNGSIPMGLRDLVKDYFSSLDQK